jgi:hypothetical protein
VIRLVGVVTFADGTVEPVEATQADFAAFELWAIRHGLPSSGPNLPPITLSRYLAYASLQRGEHESRQDWEPFDVWDGRVANVDLESPDEAPSVDPTRTGQSAGSSQRSRSQPESPPEP